MEEIVPTSEDWAWFGGYFDGEGSVTATIQPVRRHPTVRSNRLVMQLELTNTHLPTLQWLTSRFGGRISARSKTKSSVNHRPRFNWRAHGLTLDALLEVLPPFTKEKRQQLELLALLRLTSDWDLRHSLCAEIKRLKRPIFSLDSKVHHYANEETEHNGSSTTHDPGG